jgi:hypothetical protein
MRIHTENPRVGALGLVRVRKTIAAGRSSAAKHGSRGGKIMRIMNTLSKYLDTIFLSLFLIIGGGCVGVPKPLESPAKETENTASEAWIYVGISYHSSKILVNIDKKTTGGALVKINRKYRGNSAGFFKEPDSTIEWEISEEEWLDFINSLDEIFEANCGVYGLPSCSKLRWSFDLDSWFNFVRTLNKVVSGWSEEAHKSEENIINIYSTKDSNTIFNDKRIEIKNSVDEILWRFTNKDTVMSIYGEFVKIMDDMKTRIIEYNGVDSLENMLAEEYEKRFGMPMSAFERTTRHVKYWEHYESGKGIDMMITETGPIALEKRPCGIYVPDCFDYFNKNNCEPAELSAGEWLDIVKAVHKCRTAKWTNNHIKLVEDENGQIKVWRTRIFSFEHEEMPLGFLSRTMLSQPMISRNVDISSNYPPDYEDYKKLMSNMQARIKQQTELTENRFAEAYKEKYGNPISEFERTVKELSFRDSTIHIQMIRFASGASVRSELFNDTNSRKDAHITIEDWLDIINTVHKAGVAKWVAESSTLMDTGRQWEINIVYSNKENFIVTGEKMPPKWSELKSTMYKLDAKIRKGIDKVPPRFRIGLWQLNKD